MNLRELQKEAHAIAKEHGWYDTERTFGDLIALVHSELSEALEAYRERELEAYTPPDDVIGQPGKFGNTRQPHPFPGVGGYVNVKVSTKPEGVASELADVVIRVADMAEHYGVDGGVMDRQLANQREVIPDLPPDFTFGERITALHNWVSNAGQFDHDQEQWSGYLGIVVFEVERMAAHYGIDLDAAIEAKMAYNRSRPYRHGGKAL